MGFPFPPSKVKAGNDSPQPFQLLFFISYPTPCTHLPTIEVLRMSRFGKIRIGRKCCYVKCILKGIQWPAEDVFICLCFCSYSYYTTGATLKKSELTLVCFLVIQHRYFSEDCSDEVGPKCMWLQNQSFFSNLWSGIERNDLLSRLFILSHMWNFTVTMGYL